jgi:PAS domain S-box-containing protein
MKNADELVARREDHMRLMIEAMVDYAIFMLDPRGIVVTWNAGAERIKGFSADEIVGQHFSTFYTEEDRLAGKPAHELTVASVHGRYEEEGWRVRRDGSLFWASVIITALRNSDGALTGFGKVTRDLTDRKRAEDALRASHVVLEERVIARTLELQQLNAEIARSEVRYRTIISALSAVVWRCDPTGETFVSTPSWTDYSGLSEETLRGWGWTTPIHPDERANVIAHLRQSLAAREPFRADLRLLRRDGEYRHIVARAFPLTDENDGEVHEWAGVFIDITEQRRLAEQLQQSQKMEAIGQLAGGIAHDFNNLLTIISGYCELLLLDLPSESASLESVRAVSDAALRAAGLTRQLLSFSRQAVISPDNYSLNTLVRDTETLLRRVIGEDIKLAVALDAKIGLVRVDQHQMSQVLMNLAINARDAMPGGGSLTIETHAIELDEDYINTHVAVQKGRYVQMSVSDSGSGMTPEVRARIFEPFFTTKGVGQGTGLGLSVVHGIVTQSNGTIGAYSEPGVGTTIKIYLPEVVESTTVDTVRDAEIRIVGGHETILLVEDEDAVRDLAFVALEANGYFVLSAPDGATALSMAQSFNGRIDMLLTDVVMPGINGRLLAETMRVEQPDLRVVYMSGYTNDMVVRHGILQAEVAFLQKPYTPSMLLRKVRQVFDRP